MRYDRNAYQRLEAVTGWNIEVACLAQAALVLTALGYPQQALQSNQAALALADELEHPYSQAEALANAAIFHTMRGEPDAAQACADQLRILATNAGYPFFTAYAALVETWRLSQSGRAQEARDDLPMRVSLASTRQVWRHIVPGCCAPMVGMMPGPGGSAKA